MVCLEVRLKSALLFQTFQTPDCDECVTKASLCGSWVVGQVRGPRASLMQHVGQESEDFAPLPHTAMCCAGRLRLGRGDEQDGLPGGGAGDPQEQLRPDGRCEGRVPGVRQQRQREHQQGGAARGDGELGPAVHRGVSVPFTTALHHLPTFRRHARTQKN